MGNCHTDDRLHIAEDSRPIGQAVLFVCGEKLIFCNSILCDRRRMSHMIDWTAIKAEYITGTISYRKLADSWGVSFRTLSDRALREGWKEARDKHRNNVVEKTVQKVASRKATTTANKLCDLQEAADNMGRVIAEIFADSEQFHRHIVTEGLGMGATKVEERQYKKVDTKAIKDLTGAIKDLAAVMRNIYDLPTAQEQAAMDIAAERLRLDKAKAEAEQNTGDDEVKVEFFDPEEEGWAG